MEGGGEFCFVSKGKYFAVSRPSRIGFIFRAPDKARCDSRNVSTFRILHPCREAGSRAAAESGIHLYVMKLRGSVILPWPSYLSN